MGIKRLILHIFSLQIILAISITLAGCSLPAAEESNITPEITTTDEANPFISTPCQANDASGESDPVRLMYQNDHEVWIWNSADGNNQRIPLPENASAPLIAPDGSRIAHLEQDAAFDTVSDPVEALALWLFDISTGRSRRAADFPTASVRSLYPEAPQIILKYEWLPGADQLLVEVHPVPWGEGVPQPTGDLYLLDAESGASRLLLPAGAYEYTALSPDGSQIAALDSGALTEEGGMDWQALQQGVLRLIDTTSGQVTALLPVDLPASAWSLAAPVYSPDGRWLAFQSRRGLALVDARQGQISEIVIDNPCELNDCYWGSLLPVVWQPDSLAFFTMTSANDYFDPRAETRVLRIDTEGAEAEAAVLHANPFTVQFSPDRSLLAFWNQPDFDTPGADLNRVELSLLELETSRQVSYATAYVLRMNGWSPDNRHLTYTYSAFGGANPLADHLALGSPCGPSLDLPVPDDQLIDQVLWLDAGQFLAWTLPAGGIPDRYTSGLYLYRLDDIHSPVWIADLLQDYSDPYGMQMQVAIINP